MTHPDVVMQVDDVSFGYHRRSRVVCGVSGQLLAGKLHAVIGPNAAGKTTLIKLMLGQLSPHSGRVSIMDRPVGRLSAGRRAAWISYVPQQAGANFAFTVAEVVAMGRHALPRDDDAVDRALHRCELGGLVDRPFVELSAGQQQRVLLARALAQAAGDGKMMLLDEPTSAMDLAHVHRMMRNLKSVAADGVAVVAVLHDVNLAARYADQVWLLDEGRLVAAGDWATVLTPEIVGPVYGVRLRPMIRPVTDTDADLPARPVFDVDLLPDASSGRISADAGDRRAPKDSDIGLTGA